MEARTLAAAPDQTLTERFGNLVIALRNLPPVAKSAIGLGILFATLMVAESIPGLGITLPDSGPKMLALAAVYAGAVAGLTVFHDRPAMAATMVILAIALILTIYHSLHAVAQTGLTGLSLGSVFALGAVGLTLVYGILKLVNFAHGDLLTFGAYMAFLMNVTWGLPLVFGVFFAVAMTALLGVFFERVMWGPMRRRGARMLQLLLMSIGLALVIRNAIQYNWGTAIRSLDVNVTDVVEFVGLRIGRTQLVVIVVGFVVLIAIGLMLKYTLLGKRMRALSDSVELAETSGIDTSRVILYTWLFAGGLAGLAGVLAGAVTDVRPEMGFSLLLFIFAAVILGGIGDAFGALAGGLVLGVVIEWSTLPIPFQWKLAVGFAVLILVLVVRPQGIFGRARAI